MVELVIMQRLAVALALGALIGLEREYSSYKSKNLRSYGGIRTFPLISLFGALTAFMADSLSPWILVVNSLLMGVLIIAAYFESAQEVNGKLRHNGVTTEVAGFLTFFLGVLAYFGEMRFAIALAVVVALILYARNLLHNFAKKINPVELRDTLLFAVIAFVILPFLPNQGFGPLEMFNPYVIWLMVVFISGISFAGYILMKWFGDRGVALSGILGGLVSSTAVTSSFAVQSTQKKAQKIIRSLLLGVILANAIMFLRILLEVFVLNRVLFWQLLAPMLILAAVSAVFSAFLWRDAKKIKGKVELDSPFTLKPALTFGLFFAVILALIKIVDFYFSSRGIYVVSIISGFADVDAITVSLSQLSAISEIPLEVARRGIVLAALSNVAVKGGIAYLFGSKKFGRTVIAFYAVLIVLGVGLLVFF